MDVRLYQFSFGEHRGEKVIWITFIKDFVLIQQLRERFPSVKWSNSNKAWYLPDLPSLRQALELDDNAVGEKLLGLIAPENKQAFENFIDQLKLKAYSSNTIRVYTTEFAHLLRTIKHYPVNELSQERLKDYFLYCIKKEKVKENHLNSRINAVKFYFEKVLHCEKMFFDIPRPKAPKLLPKMLTKPEIKKIFKQTTNPKHLLMLKLSYGMGLRVSEIVNLKILHINSDDMLVLIAGAKGKKDRYTNLSKSILSLLRSYCEEYKPKEYLFEGQYGSAYCVRSVQLIFKNAIKKANINKSIGIHGLRHSYATQLIENGADIRFLQKLL
ncbi:tyrosine-type recombinase/integrase [Flavobacterium columnare]|uniref:tyrosine-type recombinase/integrase n=1 Tax=Flavobacterium columnare TaxID=996 RepID=UPI001CE0912A|nr:tyrosine-type recombinase/integrase [Flavobacterium columnare]